MNIRMTLALLTLVGCSSPPQAPNADESRRRPANDAQAIELQVCRSDLHNSRLGLAAARRGSEAQRAYAQRLATAWEAARAVPSATEVPPAGPPRSNGLYVVHFAFSSTQVDLPAETMAAIVDEARQAPLVVLRGRTDGTSDAPSETRIARERALAMRDLLTSAGVSAGRIRTTWQPSGDLVANNSDPAGRAANRRVEIEIYRALPMALNQVAPALR